MELAVIGVGGVGGFFGGKLARYAEGRSDLRVHFIARGGHLEAIRERGLVLDTEGGRSVCRPASATDRIEDLPDLDFCLVCVKGYDLADTLVRVKGRVTDTTVILPLLNGVDIFERVRASVNRGYLHPACVYIGTHIESPGVVRQRGPLSTIMLGRDPGRPDENRSILALFDAAGVSYVWKDDPFAEIWTKYAFIAPFGLVTAGSGCTIGEVFLRPDLLGAAKTIMAEVVALARAKGVALPGTIVEDTLARAAKFPPDTRTSFQRDVEQAGRPDERDLFGGSILRMGRELGVPVPATAAATDAIGRRKPARA